MAVTRLTTNGLTGTKYDIASADNYYMEPIATTLVGAGNATTITFSNIPNTYKHLQIRGIWANNGTNQYTFIRFNGDTGNNYAWHDVFGDGASTFTEFTGSASGIAMAYSSSTTAYSGCIYDVLDYTNTSKNKVVRGLEGRDTNGAGTIALHSGLWMNTTGITSIDIFVLNSNNIKQHSRFSLYGIKG
jgi:hypothetical protein